MSIKMRAAAKDGVTTIKALISHPMETGTRQARRFLPILSRKSCVNTTAIRS